MPETIIRASSLSGYADCPRRTAARILRSEIEDAGYSLRSTPKTIGGMVGTAMHAGTAHIMSEKRKTGLMGNTMEAEQVALEILETETVGDVLWDSHTENLDSAQKQALSMLQICRQEVLPHITPVEVEKRLEAKVREDVTLTGQVDVSSEHGIMDWKTGRIRRANGPQYGAYLLLARTHGMPGNDATEVYIKRVKADKPQPLPEVHKYQAGIIENSAIAIIKHMTRDIDAFRAKGDHREFLANPSSMLCSDKYCPAWGTGFCKEHKNNQPGEKA